MQNLTKKTNTQEDFQNHFNIDKKQLKPLKLSYEQSLVKYHNEQSQILNINEIYIRFRNLKQYQSQYDKNQQLKKQLHFWNQNYSKNPQQLQLERQLSNALVYLQNLKANYVNNPPRQNINNSYMNNEAYLRQVSNQGNINDQRSSSKGGKLYYP